jgi:LysR family nitrogen assimilation transcriptional regulator
VELRQALFLRNGRGVPSPRPASALAHARGILQQVERVRAELDESRNAPVGRVALGVPPSVGRVLSGPLVAEFRGRFPRAAITIAEGLTVHILEWLALGRVDLGIVYNPPHSPAVELQPFIEQQLYLIGQKRRGEGDRAASVELRQLPKYPLIIPSRPHTIRMLVDSRLSALGLKATIAHEIDGIRALLDLVQRGRLRSAAKARAHRGRSEREARRATDRPSALRAAMAVATSAQRRSRAWRRRRSACCGRSGHRC